VALVMTRPATAPATPASGKAAQKEKSSFIIRRVETYAPIPKKAAWPMEAAR
jgi:hypothetical protein